MTDPPHSSQAPRRPPVSLPVEGAAASWRANQTGAPQRFGLGTIMIVTASYALLVTFLKLLGAPMPVTVFLLLLVTVLGASQALLFRGRDPRLASLAIGSVAIPLFFLFSVIYGTAESGVPLEDTVFPLLIVTACCVPLGAVVGYLVGTCVAGLFLVMNRVDRRVAGRGNGPVVADVAADDAELLR